MEYSYVPLKLKAEVIRIRKACRLTVQTVGDLCRLIVPGVSSLSIAAICDDLLKKAGADAVLLGYKGFPSSVCISVNHVAAHGIPNDYVFREGDIATIDLTAGLNGWFGDYAVTIGVGDISAEKKRLIEGRRKRRRLPVLPRLTPAAGWEI